MILISQKGKIISSYSNVLVNILKSYNYTLEDFYSLKNIILSIDRKAFEVNPFNVNKYKEFLLNSKKSINTTDEVGKFIFFLLSRRYGELLVDIINITEEKMKDKYGICNITICNNDNLEDSVKKKIEKEISLKISNKNVKFIYKIDRNISDGNIDIISNEKICSLNLNKDLKSLLMMK